MSKIARKTYRVQVAYRSVVEAEFSASSLEEALGKVSGDKVLREFLIENPILSEGWEASDDRASVIGVYEMEPGWNFLDK